MVMRRLPCCWVHCAGMMGCAGAPANRFGRSRIGQAIPQKFPGGFRVAEVITCQNYSRGGPGRGPVSRHRSLRSFGV